MLFITNKLDFGNLLLELRIALDDQLAINISTHVSDLLIAFIQQLVSQCISPYCCLHDYYIKWPLRRKPEISKKKTGRLIRPSSSYLSFRVSCNEVIINADSSFQVPSWAIIGNSTKRTRPQLLAAYAFKFTS